MSYRDQPWTNADATLGGRAAHVRRNAGIEREDPTRFPFTVLVSLIYTDKNPAGRPGNLAELHLLDETEERVADAMESELDALFALCVTSDGTRDLFFFVANRPSDEHVDQLIQSIAPRVDYYFERIEDPTWHPYWSLTDSVRAN